MTWLVLFGLLTVWWCRAEPLASASDPSASPKTAGSEQGESEHDPTAISPPAGATELNNVAVTQAKAGHFEEAAALLRRAVQLDPHDATVRKNLSGILTDWASQLEQQGRVDQAMAVFQEAIERDPENGVALVRFGDLLYLKRSEIAQALTLWQRAHGHVPDAMWPGVANRISQAQRDQLIERGFTTRQTPHFDLRFEQATDVNIAALEQVLEAAHARLSQELDEGPTRLTVLVYTERDLRRLYNQRDWTVGFYDGRIRLRLDDLTQAHLPDLVAHELAHAFLQHLYGGGIPIWVHEGFAQVQEGPHQHGSEEARLEAGVAARTLWIPLKWLDRHFAQPSSTEDIARAYVQARLVVSELVSRYGMGRFRAFLSKLSQGAAIDAAYDLAFAPSRWSRSDQGIFD